MAFSILDHVELDSSGRAQCPSCLRDGKTKRNLSVESEGPKAGAYNCHRGCTTADIRAAIGSPKAQQVPTAIAKAGKPAKGVAVSSAKVEAMHQKLVNSDGPAKQWLKQRGIGDDVIAHCRLGISTANVGKKRVPAITIPIPAGGEKFYIKKRLAPWNEEVIALPDYSAWKQWGIPATLYFTNRPDDAIESWIAEGEWDAMLLGWMCKVADMQVAVATPTCGASTVVADGELKRLPGDKVLTWFDRNDTPTKSGKVPGRDGAIAYAKALGPRGYIAEVPMPKGEQRPGWDITDAVLNGYNEFDFEKAADQAQQLTESAPEPAKPDHHAPKANILKQHLQWNDDFLATAPDHTEWLLPDILTANELFLLFTPPRVGKTLWTMSLARAVALGEPFLQRPTLQGTVIYCRLEDNPAKTKERELAQGWVEGMPVAWLDNYRFSMMDELEELVAELDPRLVVIDTLDRANDSSVSDSSSEIGRIISPLQDMAMRYDCTVILVHHSKKLNVDNADNVDVFESSRGSTAIRATCRGGITLAPGENCHRMFVENGWGKLDLNVRLQPHNLRWELIGNWQPQINGDQRAAVLDYLEHNSPATIEQIHETLGIPKKSLYVVLDRLQMSKVSSEKVTKKGKRRSYTYQLADTGAIQQLNTLLNSANPEPDLAGGVISNKKDIFSQDTPSESGILGDTTSAIHPDLPTFEGDSQFQNGYSTPSNVYPERDRGDDYQLSPQNPGTPLLNKGGKTGSKPSGAGDSPIQQRIQQGGVVEYSSEKLVTPNLGESGNVIRESGKSGPKVGKHNPKLVKPGCTARYIGDSTAKQRICGEKLLEVVSVEGNIAKAKADGWSFDKPFGVEELERVD